MSKRLTSGIVAAIITVGLSVPAVGMASGKGHHYAYGKSRPCPTQSQSKTDKGQANGSDNGGGKKCGITS